MTEPLEPIRNHAPKWSWPYNKLAVQAAMFNCKVEKWEFDYYLSYLGRCWAIGSGDNKENPDILAYVEYNQMTSAIVLIHASKVG